MNKKTLILLVSLLLLFSSFDLFAQGRRNWLVRAEVGIYELHEEKETDGTVIGLKAGRHLGPEALVNLGLMGGMPDDSYASLELGLELLPFAAAIISPVIGAGAGIMLEAAAGSPSIPYFWEAGIQLNISERTSIRFTFQRGSHVNLGDPGTFLGPNLVSIALGRAF